MWQNPKNTIVCTVSFLVIWQKFHFNFIRQHIMLVSSCIRKIAHCPPIIVKIASL